MATPVERLAVGPVGFSITAGTNAADKLVSWYYDLAIIHQMVSALAYKSDPRTAALFEQLCANVGNEAYCSVMLLIAGVIFNDFPKPGLTAATYWSGYVVPHIVDVPAADAPYVTDARFRKHPRRGLQVAIAGEYGGYPEAIVRLAGASTADIKLAREMLAYRTKISHTHFHAMKETADDTTAAVCDRAAAQATKWMKQALQERSVFPIGMIWHMFEDSMSLAHAMRDTEPSEGFPYGKVLEIYYFGNQSDRSHSRDEGISAVSKPGTPGYQRVQAAARPLMTTLLYFTQAMNELGALKSSDSAAVAALIELCVEKYARVAAKMFAYDGSDHRAVAAAICSRMDTFKPPKGSWMEVVPKKIHDGDTGRFLKKNSPEPEMIIRSQDIDTPELLQEDGEEARDAFIKLATVAPDEVLVVVTHGTGKYLRTMGTFYVCKRASWPGNWDDVPLDVVLRGRNINLELVRLGWAWYYRYKNAPIEPEYVAAQEDAKRNRRGVWARENPQNPADFRAAKREADEAKRAAKPKKKSHRHRK